MCTIVAAAIRAGHAASTTVSSTTIVCTMAMFYLASCHFIRSIWLLPSCAGARLRWTRPSVTAACTGCLRSYATRSTTFISIYEHLFVQYCPLWPTFALACPAGPPLWNDHSCASLYDPNCWTTASLSEWSQSSLILVSVASSYSILCSMYAIKSQMLFIIYYLLFVYKKATFQIILNKLWIT